MSSPTIYDGYSEDFDRMLTEKLAEELFPARRAPLPLSRNVDGRPVWEPPIFNYSSLIGEEYEKKREAVMKFTGNDVAETTELMDTFDEADLYDIYWSWLWSNIEDHPEDKQSEGWMAKVRFFEDLTLEWQRDNDDVQDHLKERSIFLKKNTEGKWEAFSQPTFDFDDELLPPTNSQSRSITQPSSPFQDEDSESAYQSCVEGTDTDDNDRSTDPHECDEECREPKRRKLDAA